MNTPNKRCDELALHFTFQQTDEPMEHRYPKEWAIQRTPEEEEKEKWLRVLSKKSSAINNSINRKVI